MIKNPDERRSWQLQATHFEKTGGMASSKRAVYRDNTGCRRRPEKARFLPFNGEKGAFAPRPSLPRPSVVHLIGINVEALGPGAFVAEPGPVGAVGIGEKGEEGFE